MFYIFNGNLACVVASLDSVSGIEGFILKRKTSHIPYGLGIEEEILLFLFLEQKIETDSPTVGNPIKKSQISSSKPETWDFKFLKIY